MLHRCGLDPEGFEHQTRHRSGLIVQDAFQTNVALADLQLQLVQDSSFQSLLAVGGVSPPPGPIGAAPRTAGMQKSPLKPTTSADLVHRYQAAGFLPMSMIRLEKLFINNKLALLPKSHHS